MQAATLVPGDIVKIRLGVIVPADLRLCAGDYASIDQAGLTGQSLPVAKKVGDEAYSGSVVKQGEMEAVVIGTGSNTFFGRTARLVAGAGAVSHAQKAMFQIGNFLIVVAVALALVMVAVQVYHDVVIARDWDATSALSILQFVLVLLVASIPVAMNDRLLFREGECTEGHRNAHASAPMRGEVVIFNRSHYEDVLVVRVHNLVPKAVWSKRYELINDFEKMLDQNGTRILKFYLHISPEEQLARFKQRLDDPARQWKISETDYSERELWPKYVEAFEEAMERTSTGHAPWFVIPANHKWFRDLAISQIIADTMDEMGLKLPPTQVDIADIRRKYHAAEQKEAKTAAKPVQKKQPERFE